jgi:hypothetical protein|tara:strand:+ start:549 stop:1199 length:651 start_codon:yes stop_codon:yes gene_type:complete
MDNVDSFYTGAGTHVYIKDELTNGMSADEVVDEFESYIPDHLLNEVEMIVIGWFDEFDERQINAFYSDNCLYISNEQDSPEDMIDDLIHETAHSLESPHGNLIYGDGKLEKEFLVKRMQLHQILWQYGYKAPKMFFRNLDYDIEFDNFLLNKVGYDKLALLVQGIFISPYAATSLREYFATGFTDFFMYNSRNDLKGMSPDLYSKLQSLSLDEFDI